MKKPALGAGAAVESGLGSDSEADDRTAPKVYRNPTEPANFNPWIPITLPNDGLYITLLTEAAGNSVGKRFRLVAGKPVKEALADSATYRAQTLRIPEHEDLRDVLASCGSAHAIILSRIPEAGAEPYYIISQKELRRRLRRNPDDESDRPIGLHVFDGIPHAARLKENFEPSRYFLLDRDISEAIPEHLRTATDTAYLQQLAKAWPGIAEAGRLIVPSSSNRVLYKGKPCFNSPSKHYYFRLSTDSDWLDPETNRTLFDARAWVADLGFTVSGKNGQMLLRTVFDPSVINEGRLVFESPPEVVGDDLTVAPFAAELIPGRDLDTNDLADLTEAQAADFRRRTERDLCYENGVNGKRRRIKASAADLTWDLPIDTKGAGRMTVREFHESAHKKLRCQTPFRDSTSYAAFISRTNDGTPFLHDVGGCTHYFPRLSDELPPIETYAEDASRAASESRIRTIETAKSVAWDDPAPLPGDLTQAKETVEAAIKKAAAKDDNGAVYESAVIKALSTIRAASNADYMRYRAKVKRAHKDVLITAIDQQVRAINGDVADDRTLADEIITLVRDGAVLWHDTEGNSYASFQQDNHVEHWALASSGFKEWVSYRAYTELGTAPSEQVLKTVSSALSGIAKHDGGEHSVFLRVAYESGTYYIDLCNEDSRQS